MLSRMLLFVVLIIVSFTLTAGQKSWKVRKADCLGSDKLPGVLLAGYFFDENRGWVVGETGELRSRSVRVGLSEGLSRCDVSVGHRHGRPMTNSLKTNEIKKRKNERLE